MDEKKSERFEIKFAERIADLVAEGREAGLSDETMSEMLADAADALDEGLS